MTEAEILNLGPFKPGQAVILRGSWDACESARTSLQDAHWAEDAFTREDGTQFPVPLIILGPVDLEVADEQRMNEAGWHRKP